MSLPNGSVSLVKQFFQVTGDPGFVIGKASHCSGESGIIHKGVYVVGHTLSHGLEVLSCGWHSTPVCSSRTTLQGLFRFLCPSSHISLNSTSEQPSTQLPARHKISSPQVKEGQNETQGTNPPPHSPPSRHHHPQPGRSSTGTGPPGCPGPTPTLRSKTAQQQAGKSPPES
ncbi:hypothetical protein CRENBAI_019033 [Crenichthys baileyi]|uniref:Uncharacterized protein n=1 Tax=Crenichthys baileyi TaxID=28760 RepID=A0AAV9RWZ1_9TELE